MNNFPVSLAGVWLASTFLCLPTARAQETLTIPVDSQAFVFSPANWIGDKGRSGKLFRQTWNSYAYARVTWESPTESAQAKLLFDTSSFTPAFKPPVLAYQVDGVWKSGIPCADEVEVTGLATSKHHELTLCLVRSEQMERWGSDGASGLNVLRFRGLTVDSGSTPVASKPQSKWALIVGDSITEGIGSTDLSSYSYLIGRALQTQGYEFGISACGYSGWLTTGDKPPGDVPAYYMIKGSSNGSGGQYDDSLSRWNKLDGNRHSILDSQGHLSAYGQTGQEPALILINYGTNDTLRNSDKSDTQASITQCLAALRTSAPEAHIILIVPFGQYFRSEISAAVAAHKAANPSDGKVAIIDLGPAEARNLDDRKTGSSVVLPPGEVRKALMGNLHPNDKGYALFAAQLIPQILHILNAHK